MFVLHNNNNYLPFILVSFAISVYIIISVNEQNSEPSILYL